MRKLFLLFIIILPTIALASVKVTISDGVENQTIKSKMENTMSNLLTEINSAQGSNRALNFSNIKIATSVQTSLSMLWENSPFKCTDEEINEEYYKIIHPYVAKEYLLTNDESINKTTVENKYFFEV